MPAEPPIYSIGAVERMLGIPAATVRNWEERYGLVTPDAAAAATGSTRAPRSSSSASSRSEIDRGCSPPRPTACSASSSSTGRPALGGRGSEASPRLLILLAERDPYAAEFAEFFLQTEGYEVVLALDADDAARKFEQLPAAARRDRAAHLRRNGCRALPAPEGNRSASCLAISTLDARDEAFAAGADAFLRKPLDPLQFVSTVKDLLGKSAFLQAATV